MAITVSKYNSFKTELATGNFNLSSDTIKVLLVTDAYTFSAAHNRRDDISGEVAAGGGYTEGGATLANPSVSGGVFDADDAVWSNSTITARGAVVYKSRGGVASADELLLFISFGENKSSSAGAFTLSFDVSGILTFS